ncbi:hypothetical protein HY990_04935 [Candidatus Micrarchaeota archaeon]|nr:hypothetical protein [Candidatus Micrarchaeota archaeon]
MTSSIDYLFKTIADTATFSRTNLSSLAWGFLKLDLTSFILGIFASLPLGIVAFLFLGSSTIAALASNHLTPSTGLGSLFSPLFASPLSIGAVIFGLVFYFVLSTVSGTVSALRYFQVRDIDQNKPSSPLFGAFGSLFSRYFIYSLIYLIVVLIVFLPILAVVIYPSSLVTAFCCVFLVLLLCMMVFTFLCQFSLLELTLNSASPIDAFKNSINLVKSNLVVCLIGSFFLFVLSFVIGLPISIFNNLLQSVLNMSEPGSLVLYFIVSGSLTFVSSFVISLYVLPFQFLFWKGLKR